MNLEWVIIDEQLMPLKEGLIPVDDRSFLFGDSIYEVIITYQGKPFFTQDHLSRMKATAEGIYFPFAWDDEYFYRNIRKGLDAVQAESVYVRIVLSRGSGVIDINREGAGEPRCVFIFKPLKPFPESFRQKGVSLSVPQTRRNSPQSLNPAFKTGNYLNNILCLTEARSTGADDALILSLDDQITECTTSNFFAVVGKTLWTAPVSLGILEGITRKYLIQIAQAKGFEIKEEPFTLALLQEADEAFVSSTTKGAMPVHRVDSLDLKQSPGPITEQLNQWYWQYVSEHLDSY